MKTVSSKILCARLRELVEAITHGPLDLRSEFSMRIPAEPERDADLVLGESARRIEKLEAEVARLRGILDLVDSVDECGVMHPPHVVIDMIRDALADKEVPK